MALHTIATRDIVRISGEGAHKLLNDTLTCRFDDSLAGIGRWFALLSSQGKVQVEGLVTRADGAWWFDLDAGFVADFVRRMKLYRLRAKAEIEHMPTYRVLWSAATEAPDGDAIACRDERSPLLGTRYIVDWGDPPAGARDVPPDYAAARKAAGIPEKAADFAGNEVFAHDIALDLNQGIDFIKGCYIGQEVVSRMKHRGTARRRPVIVSGIDAPAGTAVLASGRDAGPIGQVVEGRAVAILRLDRVTDLDAVTVAGRPVRLDLPAYATYRFGESPPED